MNRPDTEEFLAQFPNVSPEVQDRWRRDFMETSQELRESLPDYLEKDRLRSLKTAEEAMQRGIC